jgi:hypothetical protein
MKANKVFEAINFERGGDPRKNLRIGKYRTTPRTFKDYEGNEQTIEVTKDNSFKLADMEVKLFFKDIPNIGKTADVYVDGQKNDFNVFRMEPFSYEFKEQGKYAKPGFTDYGMPVARDDKHLKELKDKHSYWHVSSGDYSRESKDPFVAVAQLVLFTY